MTDIRVEPAPLSAMAPEPGPQITQKTAGQKAFKVIAWTCIAMVGLGISLSLVGYGSRSSLATNAPTFTITPAIMQGCQQNYPDAADALACAERVALREKFEDQSARDEQAAKDAQTIRLYGSLDAAQKAYAEQDRIDKFCTRTVGLDNTQAWIKCEERHDSFKPRRVASH